MGTNTRFNERIRGDLQSKARQGRHDGDLAKELWRPTKDAAAILLHIQSVQLIDKMRSEKCMLGALESGQSHGWFWNLIPQRQCR